MDWLLILLPFIGGLLCFCIASDRMRKSLLILTAALHFLCVLRCWATSFPHQLNDWLSVDPLSLIFLLITSLLFNAAAIYTLGYLSQHERPVDKDRRFSREAVFTGSLLMFLATMTLAIMSQHTGVFWMAIEATTLTSAPLISFQRSSRSLEAVWKYLLICSVGIAMALIGNIALAVAASFNPVTHQLPMTFGTLMAHADGLQGTWLKMAFAFLVVGYGTKMGLVPMHTWLPDAHSEAPSPVSALLSGALLNCAFLGILRTNSILIKAGIGDFSNHLLIVFGLMSMLLAGWFIVQQVDYKRLLAYSSIEHMGILAVATGACAQTHFGAILHAVNHSLTKGLLFLVAGNILAAYHTKSTHEVKGIIHVIPLSGILWIAGFMAICGVPPFGTFVSEFSIMYGLGQAHHWYILTFMLMALGIIFVGMARVIIPMAYGEPTETLCLPNNVKRNLCYNIPPLVLGCAILVLGCWIPLPLSRLIEQAALAMGAQ